MYIPKDVIDTISNHLSYQNLCNLRVVSTEFKNIIDQNPNY